MAAKDYRICCALVNAYIAKPSKVKPNLMTLDRREITEEEILELIDWYIESKVSDGHKGIAFTSARIENSRIEIRVKPIKK